MNDCPKCGRVIYNRGGMERHVRVCQRVWSIETILAAGAVDTSKGDQSCWLWTKGAGTYAQFASGYVHRTMYALANGPLGDGETVCHSCDTPRCINPAHLWRGTQADNMKDKATKKRAPSGDDHWSRRDRETSSRVAAGMRAARLSSKTLQAGVLAGTREKEG